MSLGSYAYGSSEKHRYDGSLKALVDFLVPRSASDAHRVMLEELLDEALTAAVELHDADKRACEQDRY